MNERIRDLQIQAFADCKAFEEDKVRTDEVFERFAELIVLECMDVARQQRNPANLNYKPSERFVEDLRQHFGAEEPKEEYDDPCPDCGKQLRVAQGGGVKCSCGYWFCY